MRISGHIIDISNKRIFKGELTIKDGMVLEIVTKDSVQDQYLLPGFIDAHVHIESSMLVPSEFARMAVVHGTVATVSDPHEIGNVMGLEGVNYMIENGRQVPFKFYFGAPSCVPATHFETNGATIDTSDIEALLSRDEIPYLAEMMNWPGVLQGYPVVVSKIAIAKKFNKVVDGHAPGLRGEQAVQYIAAGISTDHECFTREEALDKLRAGMKIQIREGSAAKNFEALADLINEHWRNMMFCSDDKHPDSLEEGHINLLVKRAVARGIDLFKVLSVACINPIHHYQLPVGQLRMGDAADFIVINNLEDFDVMQTYIDGALVAENGVTHIRRVDCKAINHFETLLKKEADFQIKAMHPKIRVMVAKDGQLITDEEIHEAKSENGLVIADVSRDILKIVVVNRYNNTKPSIAYIRNFGLKKGAIASSVGHDSHNIIAVGVDDSSICRVVNKIILAKGGVAAVNGEIEQLIPLPVAGIMSDEDGYEVSKQYKAIDQMAKDMGSTLGSPFMTLSFMALLVIPSLKISDRGLFNADQFKFVNVGVD